MPYNTNQVTGEKLAESVALEGGSAYRFPGNRNSVAVGQVAMATVSV